MRSRNIKPGTFKNEILGTRDPLLTLLFEGLWCLADREGRLEDRPLRIKAEVFPYRDGLDVDPLLRELENLRFIHRYEAMGQRCILVLNFKEHQAPHRTERNSVLPSPVNPTIVNGETTVRPPSSNGGNPPDSLIPDSPIPDSNTPSAPDVAAAGGKREIDRDFEVWYSKHYPKRRDKEAARKAYHRARRKLHAEQPTLDGRELLNDRADRYALEVRGREEDKIKYPSTWLNAGSYLDEVAAPRGHPEAAAGAHTKTHVNVVDFDSLRRDWMKQREREGNIVLDVDAIWREVTNELRRTVNQQSFDTFLRPLRAGCVTREGHLVLLAPAEAFVDVVLDRYGDQIVEILRERDIDGVVVKAVKVEALTEAAHAS